ncbi:hypothetical protein ACOSQ3_004238 [Xanthoceras sorbifolium]
MDDCKPINTPVECRTKLSKHDKGESIDPTFFESLVGSLRYLTENFLVIFVLSLNKSCLSVLFPTVDLSRNHLTGEIPSTMRGLQNLQNLSLRYNSLQGSIPESFGRLISLEFLDLSNNNLSGVIPKSLEALSYLKYHNLSFNQ